MKNAMLTPPDAVRVIRVFLASPNDLGPERRAAREAVNEINRTVARPSGYQVDLIGWEDTLSSAGRPQAIINEELETCHMFIGMLWERWGTPPDLSGRFSSGFEEEYTLSYERLKSTGSPHMRLFFKDVDASKAADAGPELSKVLDFKAKRIAEKAILFQTFSDTQAFAQHVRISIADHVLKLRSERQAAEDAAQSSDLEQPILPDGVEIIEEPSSPRSEISLLETITSKLRAPDSQVSPVEVARLRNLAVALSDTSNDVTSLGAHDANLIYSSRSDLDLSAREVSALADAGIDAIEHENAPAFYWIADRLRAFPPWLAYTTVSGPDARRINTFRVMRLLRHEIPDLHASYPRADLIKSWFAETSDSVKIAALQYLAEVGSLQEIEYPQAELTINSFVTRKAAVDAIVAILLRSSGVDALTFLASAAVYDVDKSFVFKACDFMGQLSEELLRVALSSPISEVRLRAINTLEERHLLDEHGYRDLLQDVSLNVRQHSLEMLVALGNNITDAEAEKVFVRSKPKSLFSVGRSDEREGVAEFAEFKKRRLLLRSQSDLLNDSRSVAFVSDDAYFALCRLNPQAYAADLRSHFDDRFERYHDEYAAVVARAYKDTGISDAARKLLDNHEGLRKRGWMREAADILTGIKGSDDLGRMRIALDQDKIDPRRTDIDYLGRYGTVEDVARVDKAASDYRINANPTSILGATYPRREAAVAMLKLVGGKVDTLLASGVSDAAIPAIIALCSKVSFKGITSAQSDILLNHSLPDVRKATALKVLTTHSVTSARTLLHRYVGSEKHRFYNVILWLDLAESFPAGIIRTVAERELRRIT